MKIEIDLDFYEKGEKLILSNEGFDNDNFVEMYLVSDIFDENGNKTDEKKYSEEKTIPLTELSAAVNAFINMRDDNLKRESYLQ